jgi:hypothetical protein
MGRAAARREAGSRTGRGKPALLTHGQALHAPGTVKNLSRHVAFASRKNVKTSFGTFTVEETCIL